MDIIQAITLALLQGVTEFLPISSSAHLILLPQLLGWGKSSVYFNLIVHLGTLTALVFYYRKSLNLTASQNILQTQHNPLVLIGIASIPIFAFGYLAEGFIVANFYTIQIIATTTIVFALVLLVADYQDQKRAHHDQTLLLPHALLIGIAQAIALVPGTSRMGITLTAGLLLGFSRTTSSHFSLLLAIPVIVVATTHKSLSLLGETPDETLPLSILLTGFVVSAAFAFVSISLFIAFVERIGMLPFVVYRLLLGAILLLFI